MSKKLVILDINGCLAYKHKKSKKIKLIDLNEQGYTIIKCRSYCLVARPGINNFVKKLQESYNVALYSSTTFRNLEELINTVFDDDVRNSFRFIWTRNQTRLDDNFRKPGFEHVMPFDTVKPLDYVIGDPIVNSKREFSLANTLIIDNDERKLSPNPQENSMIWKEYVPVNPEEDAETLDDYRSLIESRFKILDILHSIYNISDRTPNSNWRYLVEYRCFLHRKRSL